MSGNGGAREGRSLALSLALVSLAAAAQQDPAAIPVDPPVTGQAPVAEPAADAPATNDRIGQIVVTAQKRAQDLQDVPIAVSAISADAIEQQHIVSLTDLASSQSNFHFGEVAGSGQASIRGVGFSLVSGAGEGSVAIHSDGLFIGRPGASVMLQQDLGGIEILRGPQGTLYGRNATAGVVNLISPAPPETLTFGLSALTGNLGERLLSGHIGDGFLDGRVRARLFVSNDRRDDYLENEAFPGRDQGANDETGVRFASDVDFSDHVKLAIRAFDGSQDIHGPVYPAYKPTPDALLAGPGTYSDDPYHIRTNDDGRSNKDLTGGSAKLTWELGDGFLAASQTGYVDYRFLNHDYDGDGTSNDLFTVSRVEKSTTLTQELILSREIEGWQWLAGAFYLRDHDSLDFDVLASVEGVAGVGLSNVLPGVDPQALLDLIAASGASREININNISDQKTRSIATFADTTFSITDALRMFLGARYLRDRLSQVQTSQIVSVDAPDVGVRSCQDLHSEVTKHSTTGRAGFQYDVASEIMGYVQFSTGYKTGGFGIGACGNEYDPEKLKAYEIGVKSEWFDEHLRANAAVFYYQYHDLQVEEVNLPQLIINNAQAHVKGAEIDLTAVPVRALEINLNATVLDARYTKFFNADATESVVLAPEQDLKGNTLNRSPKFAGNFSAQYTLDLASFGGVSLRGETNYTTKTWLREFNNSTDDQEAVALVNAYVTWFSSGEAWNVRAFCKNITDEAVLAGFLGVGGYKGATFQLPRTWGVSIGYEFK